MFTGIIEEVGTVLGIRRGAKSAVLHIAADKILTDVRMGDSIAVNGVCLTATSVNSNSFTADVMPETLCRSSLADLKSRSQVNLERAMAANGRFGGHIVSGHIDGTGAIKRIQKDDNAVRYEIGADRTILKYIVEKGSVTIDGISLTVTEVSEKSFSVSVIPHTISVTILGEKSVGSIVNLENDIIGKYVEKLLFAKEEKPKSNITREYLAKYGF